VWLAVFVVSGGLAIFIGVPLVGLMRQVSSSNHVELGIPVKGRVQGATEAVEMVLPGGDYVVVASVREASGPVAPHAKIRYVVEAKTEGFRMESEAVLDFASLQLREIRLKSFTLHAEEPVRVTVDVLEPGGNDLWVKLVRAPFP